MPLHLGLVEIVPGGVSDRSQIFDVRKEILLDPSFDRELRGVQGAQVEVVVGVVLQAATQAGSSAAARCRPPALLARVPEQRIGDLVAAEALVDFADVQKLVGGDVRKGRAAHLDLGVVEVLVHLVWF